jgi:hypothetical protein
MLPVGPSAPPAAPTPSWDQQSMINAAISNLSLQNSGNNDWYFDSGASSHITGNAGNLTKLYSPSKLNPSHIVVGNGSFLPIYSVGSTTLTSRPFNLERVLYSPSIIKNLISVRQFTIDNSCSIEFDPTGFSVKDLATRRLIMRSNSSGPLYPFFGASPHGHTAFTISTSDLWHRRLGHPGRQSLSRMARSFLPVCNKERLPPICVKHVNSVANRDYLFLPLAPSQLVPSLLFIVMYGLHP